MTCILQILLKFQRTCSGECSYLYNLLDSEKSADVLVELGEDEREQFIEEMPEP
jgi:Mg/Co/Ni transporter MgtE